MEAEQHADEQDEAAGIAPRPPHEVHHLLVQAPVPPIDIDGLAVISIGTALFAIAALVLGVESAQLIARGRGEWLDIAICGFLLGLLGIAYCWGRRRRRTAA